MMTPKEVQEHGFTRARKGYDMGEVDEFLDKLTEDYTALYTNYSKLSGKYSKLMKKAQALAAALEQNQSKTTAVVASAQSSQAAAAASQDAVDELLRAARKDAEAIRAGAERERQEIIARATDYAAENVERLKGEVSAEEARLVSAKKATATYVSSVRALMGRQIALLDSMPVEDKDYTVTDTDEAPAEEPTVRVSEPEAGVAGDISRSMLDLNVDDSSEDDTKVAPAADMDDTGSLFDMINDGAEFDEE